jgi:hypothetical protein
VYHGITNISVGIIKVDKIKINKIFLPGNLYFASVNPTKESKNKTEKVVIKATIELFKNHLGNPEKVKIFL